MSSSRIKVYITILVIFLIAVFLLVPRGGTVLNTDIYMAPDGKPVFSAIVDKKGSSSKLDIISRITKGADLYGQSIEKTDYGFVAYYRVNYSFDLTSVPKYVPSNFVFTADLPGRIIKIEGGDFQQGKAIWQLEVGKDVKVYAESRITRWWLIIITSMMILFSLYAIIAVRWRKQP